MGKGKIKTFQARGPTEIRDEPYFLAQGPFFYVKKYVVVEV